MKHRVLLSLMLVLVLPGPSLALLPAHQAYAGCNTCHNLHGASGDGLLSAVTQEALCLSCHGPGGISSLRAAVHNPLGLASSQAGYITCLECHNPHSNRSNALGGTNIRLVGIEYDYNTDPPTRYAGAVIRAENSSGGLGAVRDVVFESDTQGSADFNRGDGLGVCEICHDPNHHVGWDCTACHQHLNGFLR